MSRKITRQDIEEGIVPVLKKHEADGHNRSSITSPKVKDDLVDAVWGLIEKVLEKVEDSSETLAHVRHGKAGHGV